jgi:hypothetical protein
VRPECAAYVTSSVCLPATKELQKHDGLAAYFRSNDGGSQVWSEFLPRGLHRYHVRVHPVIPRTRLHLAVERGLVRRCTLLVFKSFASCVNVQYAFISNIFVSNRIWQIPVGSQQIMTIVLDAFRSGMSWLDPVDYAPGTTFAPELADYSSVYPVHVAGQPNKRLSRSGSTEGNLTHIDMLMYIMHHFPGNTVSPSPLAIFQLFQLLTTFLT